MVVYRYDSPLFFANAEDFRRRAMAAIDNSPELVRWLPLNTEANVEIDITAVDALDALREELVGRGIVLALARVKQTSATTSLPPASSIGSESTGSSCPCRPR
ncbi:MULTISPECIES: sodium-independent anion transporter [Kribbella]|uniref:sodium-independent anion transporter n=1 Tax=Kribbella TaxID=182639 RepID=UPI001F544F35|nr:MULTISPECIES: sodium-independent anion transporter [Kribbella]